jgi:very-short-patch-repair endonuclease
MAKLVRELSQPEIERLQLIANTAHGFQGDERDMVLFSPCIGDELTFGARRFLVEGGNLFNVAVTRARAQLHVFGDMGACARSGILHIEEFARYFERVRSRATRDPAIGEYEPLLGEALRAAGLAPIPQYPVGPYRLDFAILDRSRQIDVEVDGESFHRDLDGVRLRSDFVRDNFLAKRGWKVKRFWAVEVRDRLEDCVREVLADVQG